MLRESVNGVKAWGREVESREQEWRLTLPPALFDALAPLVERTTSGLAKTEELSITPELRSAWSATLAPALAMLETGRGFVVLDGLPIDRMSKAEATAHYWLVGQLLGVPFTQNIQGTLLYDVRDTGQDLGKGARFSVTNYESTYHTDNSFGDRVLDYVGLLCLKTAKSGGLSQMVSCYSVHNLLLAEFPEALEVLYQPFQVERRGGFPEGESPVVARPVIEADGEDLLFRYLRYWIETGHERVGIPLSAKQKQALDTLDQVVQRPEIRVEFYLKPGEMYFLNNRWTLHNRTAFEDYPEFEERRHLVRLWLAAERSGGN